LVWVDRGGKESVIDVEPLRYSYPRISPDGVHAALELQERRDRDIWIVDLGLNALTRLAVAASNEAYPVWMPDSRRILYNTIGAPPNTVYRRNADGSGQVEPMFTTAAGLSSYAVSRDGLNLILRVDRGLGVLSLEGDRQPRTILPGGELSYSDAALSRDGNWIAFQARAGDQSDVVVSPFPDVDRQRITVSVGGGSHPVWSPKRDELFYVNRDRKLMSVRVTTAPFSRQAPQELFDASEYLNLPSGFMGRAYDVSPVDGRFLMSSPVRAVAPPLEVVFVLNWLDDARTRLRPR
jgi:Tol biopolymer transport system component